MPATTVHRALDDTPFEGRTSAIPCTGPVPSLECKWCGSSLAGPRKAVAKVTTRGRLSDPRSVPLPVRPWPLG